MNKVVLLLLFVMLLSCLTMMAGCGTEEVGEPVGQEQQETQNNDDYQQADESIEALAPEPEITDYDIAFDAEYLGSRRFKVEGTTNLPNGSQININIRDIDYFKHDDADDEWRFENLTYIGALIPVRDGTFATVISSSEMEAPLKSAQYNVEVTFNPRQQKDEKVKSIVGANGEYIRGDFLDNSIEGLTMLRLSIAISLEP